MGTQLLGTPPPFFLAPILLYSCLTHTVLKPLTRAALESCQMFSVTVGPNLAPQPSLNSLGKKWLTLVPMGLSSLSVPFNLVC